jgi:hypothetical protein
MYKNPTYCNEVTAATLIWFLALELVAKVKLEVVLLLQPILSCSVDALYMLVQSSLFSYSVDTVSTFSSYSVYWVQSSCSYRALYNSRDGSVKLPCSCSL